MRTILYILWLVTAQIASGSQSVKVTGGVNAQIYVQPVLSSSTAAMRWEWRIHNFGNSLPVYVGSGAGAISSGQQFNGGTLGSNLYTWGGISGTVTDTLSPAYQIISGFGDYIPPYGVGDVLARMQRIPSDPDGVSCGSIGAACYTFEICYTLGGKCSFSRAAITALASAGSTLYMDIFQGMQIAFFRWWGSTVDAGLNGTGLLSPIPAYAPAVPSVLLGDWEFEGNLNDSSGHSVAFQPYSNPTVSYVTTPTYAPSCSAGAQQTVKTGVLPLAGSGQPLDGGSTITYAWTQASSVGPSGTATWTSSQSIPSPTAMLPSFGSYNFQLTVTDGSSQSTSCTVHDGAVVADSNGVVTYPSGALYDAVNTLLGPVVQYGKNPWSWYDTTHKSLADTNAAALGPPAGNGQTVTVLGGALASTDMVLVVADSTFNNSNTGAVVLIGSEQILLGANVDSTHITIWQRSYRGTSAVASVASGTPVNQFFYWDWWNYHTGPGTITVTGGSAAVVGVGTAFKTGGQYALCDSTGAPLSAANLIVWHPTWNGSQKGRALNYIASCTDDTHLTLAQAWPAGGGTIAPAGGGLTYTVGTAFELYWDDPHGDPRTPNYYDNVAAYYQLWLRSGIDTYLIAARQLADMFWTCPYMDLGYAIQLQAGFSGFDVIAKSELGLWLRNLDSPPIDMTRGLEIASSFEMYYLYASPDYRNVGDARDSGYRLSDLAYLALLDSSSTRYDLSAYITGATSITYSAAAAQILAALVTATPSGSQVGHNFWYTGQTSSGLWPKTENSYSSSGGAGGGGGSVTLTNGQSTFTLNSTSMPCSTIQGWAIWFWHSTVGTFPAYGVTTSTLNSGGDPTFYTVTSCNSSTQGVLNTIYAGASCAACGYEVSTDDGFVGWGAQAYQVAIGIGSVHRAAIALIKNGYAVEAASARTIATNAFNWILTDAYLGSPAYSINYGADFVNCQPSPGTLSAPQNCTKGPTITGALAFGAEFSTAYTMQYMYDHSATTKAAGDGNYNQEYAKPGTCVSSACNDSVTTGGNYQTGLDPFVNGYYLDGTPPNAKWLGQWAGFGNQSAWPAIRLSGVSPFAQAPSVMYGTVVGAVFR